MKIIKCPATAIISPEGEIEGISLGDVSSCMPAWTQAVDRTGKYIPELMKLSFKIKEGFIDFYTDEEL